MNNNLNAAADDASVEVIPLTVAETLLKKAPSRQHWPPIKKEEVLDSNGAKKTFYAFLQDESIMDVIFVRAVHVEKPYLGSHGEMAKLWGAVVASCKSSHKELFPLLDNRNAKSRFEKYMQFVENKLSECEFNKNTGADNEDPPTETLSLLEDMFIERKGGEEAVTTKKLSAAVAKKKEKEAAAAIRLAAMGGQKKKSSPPTVPTLNSTPDNNSPTESAGSAGLSGCETAEENEIDDNPDPVLPAATPDDRRSIADLAARTTSHERNNATTITSETINQVGGLETALGQHGNSMEMALDCRKRKLEIEAEQVSMDKLDREFKRQMEEKDQKHRHEQDEKDREAHRNLLNAIATHFQTIGPIMAQMNQNK